MSVKGQEKSGPQGKVPNPPSLPQASASAAPPNMLRHLPPPESPNGGPPTPQVGAQYYPSPSPAAAVPGYSSYPQQLGSNGMPPGLVQMPQGYGGLGPGFPLYAQQNALSQQQQHQHQQYLQHQFLLQQNAQQFGVQPQYAPPHNLTPTSHQNTAFRWQQQVGRQQPIPQQPMLAMPQQAHMVNQQPQLSHNASGPLTPMLQQMQSPVPVQQNGLNMGNQQHFMRQHAPNPSAPPPSLPVQPSPMQHSVSQQPSLHHRPSQPPMQPAVSQQPSLHHRQSQRPAYEPGGTIERVFRSLAVDGALDIKAFVEALRLLGFSEPSHVARMKLFMEADDDHSSDVTLSEFVSMLQKLLAETAFLRADTGKTGSLECRGFRTALESLGLCLSYSELMTYYQIADNNQGMDIDTQEFTLVLQKIADEKRLSVDSMLIYLSKQTGTASITPQMAGDAFSRADSTNKGNLDFTMLMKALKLLGIDGDYEHAKSLFPKFDRDRNGNISRQEFIDMFSQPSESNAAPKGKYASIKGRR